MTKLLKGELSFMEATNQISAILGHEVTVTSVRNRILYFLPRSNNQKDRKNNSGNGRNNFQKYSVASKLVFISC